MKKLFVFATSLAILTASFAQDAKLEQPKKVKEEVKKAADKKTDAAKKEVSKSANTKTAKTKAAGDKASKKVATEAPVLEKLVTPAKTEIPAPIEQIKPTSQVPTVAEQPAPAAAPLLDPAKDFEFTNDAYDFGKIPAGKPAKYTLTIKNISNTEQELTMVQPGCGCTTPEYTQGQKFKPGESVKVNLGYNGGGATGSPFSKSVTVTLKGHNPKVVTFRGETYTVPTESAPSNEAADKLKPAGH